MKKKEVWSLTDHSCRHCGGGRILQAEFSVITGGGNPLFRCADCGQSGSGMTPDALCWCGWSFKGSTQRPYHCAPKAKHPEWRRAFEACGCWNSPHEIGIVNEDYLAKLLAEPNDAA